MARRCRHPMFKGRHFDQEIIVLCVRWYVTYKLSYRDLAAMMLERGIAVALSTIFRWVQRYVPEFEKRWDRFPRPVFVASGTRRSWSKQRGTRIDLTRKLDAFADYYNAHRVHRSLNGTTPIRRACASFPPPARAALRKYAWEEHCRGLFHTPIPP